MRRAINPLRSVAFSVGYAAASIGALLLAGCSTTPLPPMQDTAPLPQAGTRQGPPASASVPSLPPAGSGRGAYYKDDGPADAIPEGLAATPDAQPRIEPILPRANRPYVVFGKSYTPISDERPFRQRGIASWYGKKFHGQRTSSGEPYDMFKMTAAHPTLPIPSYVRVTHVASGKQVIVRINDRGPFHSGRVIDLSYTAALKLGYLGRGSGEVEVERLLPDEIARINSKPVQIATTEAVAQVEVGAVAAPSVVTTSSAPAPADRAAQAAPWLASAPASSPEQLSTSSVPAAADSAAPGQPPVFATAGSFYLQLGAFSQQANANQAAQRMSAPGTTPWPGLQVVQSNGLYRLYGGPYASRAEAEAAAQRVAVANSVQAIIVQR